jgi:hypothetical protein
MLLTEEEARTVERAALAEPRTRELLSTDRPRVISVTVEPNKAQAGAFLSGTSATAPSRRATVVLFNAETNRAGQVVLAVPSGGPPRVLEVRRIDPADVPFGPEDARAALDLARRDPAVRRAVGDILDRFELLEPDSDTQPPYAAQVLPLRSTNPQDPCANGRCLDIIFRTQDGYLSVRPTVNLTRRTVTLGAVPAQGGHRR